jgi:hypothetical protein
MNVWMNVTVCYTKQFEDGTLKRVNEPYVVAASSFTDAEARINQLLGETIRGEFYVKSISRIELMDIFGSGLDEDWFKATIQHTSINADNGKAQKLLSQFLVQSSGVIAAGDELNTMLKDSGMDYELKSVVRTKIVDVFSYFEQPTSYYLPSEK